MSGGLMVLVLDRPFSLVVISAYNREGSHGHKGESHHQAETIQ
jgi:hypothetical protein